MAHDLNDLLFFSMVVDQKGFSAAARVLNQPKSSVSRHVDRLERRLGVRLLERTTRRIRLTEVGALYHAHCRLILGELETAEREVGLHRTDPVGVIRVSCPTGVASHILAGSLSRFLANYPAVSVNLLASDSRFNLIEDRIDIAIRARMEIKEEDTIVRRLGTSRLVFVASPAFVRERGAPSSPVELADRPFLSQQQDSDDCTWTLRGPDGAVQSVTFRPILCTGDTAMLMESALSGVGFALLPFEIVGSLIRAGRLEHLLSEWRTTDVTVHLAYPSRRGLRPAVRAFIDFLVEEVATGRWPLAA